MNKISNAVIAAIALLAVPHASAAPVTEWGFSVTLEWSSAVFTSGNGSQIVSPELVSWGASGGDHTDATRNTASSRSGLEITDSLVTGSMVTNDTQPVLTNVITHYNNAIRSSFASLTSLTLVSTLTLTPLGPNPGAALDPFHTIFELSFTETPNVGNCTFPSATSCDDIFVVTSGSFSKQFEYDGFTYLINTIETMGTLGGLHANSCAAANAAPGCIGIQTPEGAFTSAQFGAFITVAPLRSVPEPGMLALAGLGLLGLSLTRRRKSA